ncbi:MAG: [LysW]-lysine hydrolase [Chloroflexi bacterium]|nr:[LysW]-lysine hydrolase [Chloroflexota bacterium]
MAVTAGPAVRSSSRDVEARYTSGVYGKRDVTIVRGEGAVVWDDTGKSYLDCTAGYGTANIGHAHPAVTAAIARQAGTLVACQEAFYNDRRAELLELLASIVPAGLERFFLCNSGSEANEAALKFARLTTGRTGVVATQRGFHGRTMGSLSATWEPQYRQAFEPLVPGTTFVPYDRLAAMEEAISDTTAAVIVEVVQGEGGVRPASPGYLAAVAELCRQRGAMLIVDEIQTGFGRTGRMFACEHESIVPDLLCVAKSMAGGFPIGAVAIGPRITGLRPGLHGSTFGGNPLACAASIATIGVLQEEGLPDRAAVTGAAMLEQLRALNIPVIREVRGLGLMIGIELRDRVRPTLNALQERGILALQAGSTTLRLLPPLVISEEQVQQAVATIEQALRLWQPGQADARNG